MKIKTKIIDELYNEANEHRKRISKETADQIQAEFNSDNEARNAAEQALNKIIDFIEGGGQLDIDLGDSSTEESEPSDSENNSHSQLRELISSIRKDMKLLPPLPASDSEETPEE